MLSENIFKISITIFIITYLSSIIILFNSLERNIIYFILVSISATLILLQIFSKQSNYFYKLILIEILFLAININSSVFIYPVYNGYGDIFFHQFATQTIALTGNILSPSHGQYSIFPLTSILSGMFKLITSIPTFYSWVIPIPASYLLSILFTFYIGFYLKGEFTFWAVMCINSSIL